MTPLLGLEDQIVGDCWDPRVGRRTDGDDPDAFVRSFDQCARVVEHREVVFIERLHGLFDGAISFN
ncbi:hypothetical protein CSX12_11050 [Microbacterium sp. Y-01]|nr:hypothetical protein CSX12_11050 [Microbacterium sp. Y-01]